MSVRRPPRLKFALFCLLPAVLLLVGAEIVARVTGAGSRALVVKPLPGEFAGVNRPDAELFWSLRPEIDTVFDGIRVQTNTLGLRSPEVGPKLQGELRVLSVGESTTFGAGVPGDSTYSALLEVKLERRLSGRPVTVINAGVSAYSSFQGLRYIETRGLKLEPDFVVFYHELNDYLPSTVRDSAQNEVGVLMTDAELHGSVINRLHRGLTDVSALYRWLGRRAAASSVRAFNRENFDNPLLDIGLPDIALGPRLFEREGRVIEPAGLNEKSLGRRVSDAERRANLVRLAALCRENGIQLLLIHPAYRESRRHECILTRFAKENGVPMLEAYDLLHPAELPPGALFLDAWHPGPEGHARLAGALAQRIERMLTDGP